MKDVKVKPTMTKPKVIEKVNILTREAGAIMKERYVSGAVSNTLSQARENPKASNTAANDAINNVEANAKSAASYTSRMTHKGVEKGFEKIRNSRSPKEKETSQNADTANELNTPKERSETDKTSAAKTKQPNNNASQQNGEAFSFSQNNDQTPQIKQKMQADKVKQKQADVKNQSVGEQRNMGFKVKDNRQITEYGENIVDGQTLKPKQKLQIDRAKQRHTDIKNRRNAAQRQNANLNNKVDTNNPNYDENVVDNQTLQPKQKLQIDRAKQRQTDIKNQHTAVQWQNTSLSNKADAPIPKHSENIVDGQMLQPKQKLQIDRAKQRQTDTNNQRSSTQQQNASLNNKSDAPILKYSENVVDNQTLQPKRELQIDRAKQWQTDIKNQRAAEQRQNASINTEKNIVDVAAQSKTANKDFIPRSSQKESVKSSTKQNKATDTLKRQSAAVKEKQKQSVIKNSIQNKSTVKQSTAAKRTEKKMFSQAGGKAKTTYNKLAKSAQQRAKARAVKKAQKEMAKKAAQQTVKAAKTTAKVTKKVVVAVAKAAAALVKGLVALVGGGGAILIILIIIAVAAAVIASPFGLFFSGEDNTGDAVAVSTVVSEINTEFGNELDEIQSSINHNYVEIHGVIADWADMLAVFAVKTASGEDEANMMDVVTIDRTRVELIKQVFWDMNSLRYEIEIVVIDEEATERILHIYVDSKSYADMPDFYSFTAQQREALDEMLKYRDMLIALAGSLEITSSDAAAVMASLPSDTSADRKAVVQIACSLVGKVNYFWGGKSTAIGWDSRWGNPQKVTDAGSSTTGTIRPFGLDCSGFVTWTFVNAGKSAGAIGNGTYDQNAKCTTISWSEALPGDLVFYGDLSHVGIIAGRDDSGNLLVVHCNSSANNVSITGVGGFAKIMRPGVF